MPRVQCCALARPLGASGSAAASDAAEVAVLLPPGKLRLSGLRQATSSWLAEQAHAGRAASLSRVSPLLRAGHGVAWLAHSRQEVVASTRFHSGLLR